MDVWYLPNTRPELFALLTDRWPGALRGSTGYLQCKLGDDQYPEAGPHGSSDLARGEDGTWRDRSALHINSSAVG